QIVSTGDPVSYDQPVGPLVNAYRALTLSPAAAPAAAPDELAFVATPNPARGACALAFSLARAGHVTVAIEDVAGRRVRTLASGPLPAGRHELRWSGDGADGRPVAPGVYFARLTRDGRMLVRRIVRV